MLKFKAFIVFLFILLTQLSFSQVIWDEDFSDNSAKWYTDDHVKVIGGKYIFYSETQDCSSWNTQRLGDFQMTVDTHWRKGAEDLGYGLVFRFNDRQHFYVFFISANGFFTVGKVTGNYVPLQAWTPTSAVNKKGANRISIKCQGNQLEGFCNNQRIFVIEDTTIPSGGFGFFASKSIRVEYDNLLVEKLSAKSAETICYQGKIQFFDGSPASGLNVSIYQILDVENLVLTKLTTITSNRQGRFQLDCDKDKSYLLQLEKDEEGYFSSLVDSGIWPQDKEVLIQIPSEGFKE